jgi:hypothetical protein
MPFEPFAIKWEKGSLPEICQDWSTGAVADEKAANNRRKIVEVAEAVFKPLAALSFKEAIESLMNITMKSESTVKRHLKDLLVWGIVTKGTDGFYRINTAEGSRVHQGSN